MESEDTPALNMLWSAIVATLEKLGRISDRLDPPRIPEFARALQPLSTALENAIAKTEQSASHEQTSDTQSLLRAAAQLLLSARRMESAQEGPHEILKAYQALRPLARAQEILLPLAARHEGVSRHFTTPGFFGAWQTNQGAHRLSGGGAENGGLFNFNNERGRRGGYSLYVPEYYSSDRAWPLVVTLHGGSGHGADMIWSWIREARTFGFLVAAPTSRGRTWSLQAPGVDAGGLNRMLADISARWRIDTGHLLLNGISDGGTFGMLLAIVRQSPFTHYAPVAAAVHVLMNRTGIIEAPVRGLSVYQVHGTRDWMFPIEKARQAATALQKADADITFREIPDLSHNYPQDENVAILRWFCPDLIDSVPPQPGPTPERDP